MTDTSTVEQALVTQEDRDAAANWYDVQEEWPQAYADGVREGTEDDDALVQSFARHRIAALAKPVASPDALVERIRAQAFEEAAKLVMQMSKRHLITATRAGQTSRAYDVAEAIRSLSSTRPVDEVREAKFSVGDLVVKPNGYRFDSEIRSVFTTRAGKVRVVAENRDGLLHIFNEDQLQALEGVSDGQ